MYVCTWEYARSVRLSVDVSVYACLSVYLKNGAEILNCALAQLEMTKAEFGIFKIVTVTTTKLQRVWYGTIPYTIHLNLLQ